MGKLQELNSLRQIIPPEYQDNVLQYMDTVLKGMGYELDFSDQEMELADKENEYIIHGLALKCKVDKGQIIIPPEVQIELTAMVNPLQTGGKHLTKHMPIVIGPKWLEYGPVVAACLTMHIKQHERVDDDKQIGQMEGQIQAQQALQINQQPIQGDQGNVPSTTNPRIPGCGEAADVVVPAREVIPPAPPARKVILMPDCRSFNMERHCDAGKKTVNCCGPDCRQYLCRPKPVAALLIAQLTKK